MVIWTNFNFYLFCKSVISLGFAFLYFFICTYFYYFKAGFISTMRILIGLLAPRFFYFTVACLPRETLLYFDEGVCLGLCGCWSVSVCWTVCLGVFRDGCCGVCLGGCLGICFSVRGFECWVVCWMSFVVSLGLRSMLLTLALSLQSVCL